jgi:hypothetical protein
LVQGTADKFYQEKQLLPENFAAAAGAAAATAQTGTEPQQKKPVTLRYQEVSFVFFFTPPCFTLSFPFLFFPFFFSFLVIPFLRG